MDDRSLSRRRRKSCALRESLDGSTTMFQWSPETLRIAAAHVQTLVVRRHWSQQIRGEERSIIDEAQLVPERVAAIEAALAPWLRLDLAVDDATGLCPNEGEIVLEIGNRKV
jgi:hypothetical protein